MARVRAAGVLGRSRQLQRLFDYLAGCALRQHVPKEAEVAIEAFGRDAGFDGARDTSVRVVVHKLRQRLDTYYGRPGTITAGRLRVPRGEYRLAFEPEGVPLAASGLHGTLPSPAWWQAPWTRRERAGVLLLAVLIVALAALGWRLATRPSVHRPAAEALQLMPWQPLQQGRLPVMVVLGDYFIFGERDAAGTQPVPSRLVREFDINSRRDLQRRQQADPALARRGMDLDLGYLPTSVGVALNDVLPVLAPGVLIHIHDVAGNLEYPREWLDEGRAWNEQYLLRAFLMNNSAYRIELFTGWLLNTRHEWIRQHMPLCAKGGGGQMWLRKLTK